MTARLLSAAALCLPLVAGAAERCSISGAEDWRAYRSRHFDLATDVGRARAAVLVGQLEKMHALVVKAMFGEDVEIPGRVRVVAFGSPGQFQSLAPEHADAFVTLTWLGEPAVAFPVPGFEAGAETIAHELAHHISWHLFPRQPAWFGEGLAIFVQTVGVIRADEAPATGTHVVRGERRTGGRWAGSVPRRYALAASEGVAPAKAVLAWAGRPDDTSPGRLHVSSWLLYHFLWNHHSKQLAEFQRRLSEAEDPDSAWRAAFPEYDPGKPEALASLDARLDAYRKGGRFASYAVEAEADLTVSEVRLPTADLHLLLLGLRRRWPAKKEEAEAQARAEVEEALREDPAQPEAVARREARDPAAAAVALRRASSARPGDWRAWFLLAEALQGENDRAEQESALRTAVRLAPDAAPPHAALARLLVQTGRAREALRLANRAVDFAPWEAGNVDALAAVAVELGKCPEALTLERRALALLGARDEARRESFEGRLRKLEARCAGPRR